MEIGNKREKILKKTAKSIQDLNNNFGNVEVGSFVSIFNFIFIYNLSNIQMINLVHSSHVLIYNFLHKY